MQVQEQVLEVAGHFFPAPRAPFDSGLGILPQRSGYLKHFYRVARFDGSRGLRVRVLVLVEFLES